MIVDNILQKLNTDFQTGDLPFIAKQKGFFHYIGYYGCGRSLAITIDTIGKYFCGTIKFLISASEQETPYGLKLIVNEKDFRYAFHEVGLSCNQYSTLQSFMLSNGTQQRMIGMHQLYNGYVEKENKC